MHKVGIVYNPSSGSNKYKPERKKTLEKILGHRGIIRETNSVDDIPKVAQEFKEQNVNILATCGGDGTHLCVLTTFCEIYKEKKLPAVFYLRGGTFNLRETSFGMKGSPEWRLKQLVKFIDKGKFPTLSHTLLKVNDKYGCIFGNGMVANFMEEYYQGGNASIVKAFNILTKAVFTSLQKKSYLAHMLRPINATIEVAGKQLPGNSFTGLLAATTTECGLGFKPFYRAREKEGHLHFLALNLTPWDFVKNLPLIRAGKAFPKDKAHDIVAKEVVINTNEHYYYTVDGEMLNSTKRIVVSTGPTVPMIVV